MRHRGYDFREYARASLRRRVKTVVKAEHLGSISALQAQVLHNTPVMDRLLQALTVNVSEMFRDPAAFRSFRENVVPVLRTYPLARIWSAACSSGEEPYSLAIVLEEEGIYDRCRIYATDLSHAMVRRAREGIFPQAVMAGFEASYAAAGGKRRLSSYCVSDYDHVVMNPSLRRNIIFARHNLASDASFNEFQVIFCRNVMIYFQIELQRRVMNLLHESLSPFGFLCLGNKESLRFMPHEENFRQFGEREKIYRKIS